MIWLRFWKPLAAVAIIALIVFAVYRSGYSAGHAASEAHWQPLFVAAAKAKAAADARADAQESAGRAISQKSEQDYADRIQELQARSDAADGRIRQLVRNVTATRCGEVPEASRSAPVVDERSPIIVRIDEAGARLAGLARDCEADAAQLAALQSWVTAQHLLAVPPPD